MTADQRFTLILSIAGIVTTAFGWFLRRLINTVDQANRDREKAHEALQSERQAAMERHYNRNMDAITGIAGVVAENNTRLTAHYEGIADRLARIEGMFGDWLKR